MSNGDGEQFSRSVSDRSPANIIAFIVASIVLGAILLVLMRPAKGPAKLMNDGSHLRGIHQSMVVAAADWNGSFPRPSRIMRLPTGDIHTMGPPNPIHDHSAAVYSVMIMNNRFGPELLISPNEPSGLVSVMDDYNWELYAPADRVFWDPNFNMNLEAPDYDANASYAHLTLTCTAADTNWRDTVRSDAYLLGTRGTQSGAGPGEPDHDKSITTKFFAPYDTWAGNVVRGDGSVQLINAKNDPGLVKSIFNRSDNWLSISTSVIETNEGYDVIDVYDPID